MVRLLPEQILGAVDAVLCFNPTMVRLLHRSGSFPQHRSAGFNPTMVRLLRAAVC